MKQYLRILLVPAVFLLICAVFFYPTFINGKLPVPADTLVGLYHPWRDLYGATNPRGIPYKNFLITDPVRQQIPWRKLAIDSIRQGVMPWWNPYAFSGTPLLGNIQAGVLYPLNVLFFLLPFAAAWSGIVMAQPLVGGLLLYLFLTHKKIGNLVALGASVAWSFSGFFIAWLTWGTIAQAAAWLPLMLLAVDRIMESRSRRSKSVWMIVFALAGTMALLAGHAQVAFYVWVFTAAYALFQLWHQTDKSGRLWIAGGVVLAGTLSSLQLIPFTELLLQSARVTDASVWMKDGWFLPWQHLAQFVAPDFFGNPATLNYWGIWNYGEFVGYVGILPLICALFAVLVRRDRLTRFFALACGIVFLFLLPTPLAKLPYWLGIPLLSTLQPTRLMVLIDFCLVTLAALGMDFFLRNSDKRIWYGVGTVFVFLAALWGYVLTAPGFISDPALIGNLAVAKRNLLLPSLLWAGSGILLTGAVLLKKKFRFLVFGISILVITFDLFRFGWKFTPFTPVEYFFPSTNVVAFLQSQTKPFRVMSLDDRLLPPNTSSYYGIESAEGYDPVYDARYEEFVAALNRKQPNITPPFGFNRIITISTLDSPLVRLLNVKYILSLEVLQRSDVELMYSEGETNVYWYRNALPRIYPVESVKEAKNKQEAMDILYSSAFDPVRQAVIEEPLSVGPLTRAPGDRVTILEESPSGMSAQSTFSGDHFVVIANRYDSRWKVFIDGAPVKMYRANYLFQGVVVPKGTHTIVVRYQ